MSRKSACESQCRDNVAGKGCPSAVECFLSGFESYGVSCAKHDDIGDFIVSETGSRRFVCGTEDDVQSVKRFIRHVFPLCYNSTESHWEKVPAHALHTNGNSMIADKYRLRKAPRWQKRLEKYSDEMLHGDAVTSGRFALESESVLRHWLCSDESWSYGFLLGEGFVAIDCDVDDDALSFEILKMFDECFPSAPIRSRGGSRWASVLYAGDLSDVQPEACRKMFRGKNMVFPDGADRSHRTVEFLCDGKQLVVHGWHPTNAPYAWYGGSVSDMVRTSVTEPYLVSFADIMSWRDAVMDRLGAVSVTQRSDDDAQAKTCSLWDGMHYGPGAGGMCRKSLSFSAALTEQCLLREQAYLRQSESYIGEDDTCIFLMCPNYANHGDYDAERAASGLCYTDGREGDTVYLKESGGFKCFHSHCEGYDFREHYFGHCSLELPLCKRLYDKGYANLKDAYVQEDGERVKSHSYLRSWKSCSESRLMFFSDPSVCGVSFSFDTFMQRAMFSLYDGPCSTDGLDVMLAQWNDAFPVSRRGRRQQTARPSSGCRRLPVTDIVYGAMMCRLCAQGFEEKASRRAVIHEIEDVAYANRYDSLADSLRSIPKWDGTVRLDATFCERYMGIEIDDSRAVTSRAWLDAVVKYMMTALWGRMSCTSEDGIKADTAIVLTGPQGIGKSSFCKALAMCDSRHATADFKKSGADMARSFFAHTVMEIEELGNMNSRSVNEIKSLLSAQVDRYTPKYANSEVCVPRRCIFIITTNDARFLRDDTGNRRFAVLECGKAFDLDTLKRDIVQLYAEARVLYEMHGIMFKALIDSHAQESINADHIERDPWENRISEYAQTRRYIDTRCIDFIASSVLEIPTWQYNKGHRNRICRCLRQLGWENAMHTNGRYWTRDGDMAELDDDVPVSAPSLSVLSGMKDTFRT